MKMKKFTVTLIAVLFTLCTTVFAKKENTNTELYVAPDGNDAWSGRFLVPNGNGTDGPLASLAGARDTIRALRSAGDLQGQGATVRIRGGFYRLEAPFVLAPEDSGRESPIVYEAMSGERPVFSGGREVRHWQKGDGSLWIADIPDVKAGEWYFHQLFVNGRRACRARTPNEDCLRTQGQLPGFETPQRFRGNQDACMGFKYRPDDLTVFSNMEDVNIFLYHSWTSSLHWVRELDEKERLVHFRNRCGWPVGWWDGGNQRYHVENCYEALDAPGEWYLERSSGKLYYWPLEDEDPDDVTVVAPVLDQLVRVEGDQDSPVGLIHLKGLCFSHADWNLPKDNIADGQAATFLNGALHLKFATSCRFESCEISHVGSYGVWFDEGTRNCLLSRCELFDMGGGGARIGCHKAPSNGGQVDQSRTCFNNHIDNCFIHDGGKVFPAGCGVIIQHAHDNRITHNEISDFFYTGISIGWSWGYQKSPAYGNVAEYNHVHHLGWKVLSDMGGVYTLGVSPGTRVNHNIFHHIQSYGYGGWGLYTDEGSSGIEMAYNVVYKTKTGSFHQHYGKNNHIHNNILAFSATHQLQRSREEDHNSFFFERNIIYYDNGKLLSEGGWSNNRYTMDSNLYWNAGGDEPLWNKDALDAWQARGHDRLSVVTDPLFEDPYAFDFRLLPGSPALGIGFVPIAVGEVGLYGDPEWVNKPQDVSRRVMLFE